MNIYVNNFLVECKTIIVTNKRICVYTKSCYYEYEPQTIEVYDAFVTLDKEEHFDAIYIDNKYNSVRYKDNTDKAYTYKPYIICMDYGVNKTSEVYKKILSAIINDLSRRENDYHYTAQTRKELGRIKRAINRKIKGD